MTSRTADARSRTEGGFTLIELLVVIIILGVLSAVVVFAVRGTGDKGSSAAAITDARTIRTAQEAHCAKFGYYGTADDLVRERFLSEKPTLHRVELTGGGTCRGKARPELEGQDPSQGLTGSGFVLPCADDQTCSTMTVGTTGDGNSVATTATSRASLGFSSPTTQIFETLTELGPSYEVLPKLATRWTFVPHATRKDAAGNPMTSPYTAAVKPGDPETPVDTWRFNIRTGVTFHNGAPLDAAAVKAGLFDPVAATAGTGIAGGSIRAAADSTQVIDNTCTTTDNCIVDFTPRVHNFRVPQQLVHPNLSVVAPGTIAGANPPGSTTYQAVGTGPFRFASYTPASQLAVTRSDTYWGTKALLKNLAFRFYPNNTTRRQALEAGDIDFAFELARPDIAGVRAKGFTVATSAVGAYQALLANLNPDADYDCRGGATPAGGECHDILADAAVRKAISMGIDRQALVNAPANFDGLATTDQTLVPPSALSPHQGRVIGVPFNLAGAKTLLDNAGWEVPAGGGTRVCTPGTGKPCTGAYSGRALDLTLVSGFGSVAVNEPLPDYLDGRLTADLNVNIDVVKNDRGYTCTNPQAGTGTGADVNGYHGRVCSGRGDLFIEQGSQNDANPSFLPLILFYNGPGQTPSSYQHRFNPGATFNNLLTPVFTEPDLDSVRRQTADAMHEAIDVQAVGITLAGIQRIYSMKSSVVGFVPFPATVHVKWAGVAKSS